ncbi:MAG: multidrug effflux MFS transporter [Alphaproteobacteria bacterium]
MPGADSSPPSWRLIVVLALSAAVGMMASSIYIPSIPSIAGDLAAGIGSVQLTVTVFLFAFGIAMLVHGPLSDRFGRKPVLVGGMALGGLGSLGCALSMAVEWLLIFRIVQAIGVCAGVTIGRAILRDVYSADGARRPMSALAMVSGIAPAAAPSLGGLMEVELGWRSQFYLMTIFCAVLCIVIGFGMAESNRALQRDRSLFGGMFSSFRELLGSRAFLFYAASVSCGSSCFYLYTVGLPVALAAQYRLSPDIIGFYTGFPPMGFITVSTIMTRFAHRLSIETFIRIGTLGLAMAGLILTSLSLSGVSDPLLVCGPAILIGMSNGLVMPSGYAGSVSINPRIAGAASGLAGFLQMVAGASATAYAAALPGDSMVPLMASLFAIGLTAAMIGWFLTPRRAG